MSESARLRGAVYVRRSTDRQEDSLESQLRVHLENAARLGVPVDASLKSLRDALSRGECVAGELYVDDARTGADLKRPGLQALKRQAAKGRITHVFLWSRDRLSRSPKTWESVGVEMDLRLQGVSVVLTDGTVEGPVDLTDGVGMEAIRLMLEYSRAGGMLFDLSKNVLRAQGQNAKNCYWNGGRAPDGMCRFSYDPSTQEIHRLRDGETVGRSLKVIVLPGDDEASRERLRVVAWIHEAYHRDFGGIKAIAKELNRLGIPSPRAGTRKGGRKVAGKWTASQVSAVLEQPAYMSKYTWGRRSEGASHRYDSSSPSGFRKVRRDELLRVGVGRKSFCRDAEEWDLADPVLPYPPVVPPEMWWSNVEKLASRGEKGGQRGVARNRDGKRHYPIRVVCGACRANMVGVPGPTERLYKCSTYLSSMGESCAHNWIEVRMASAFALQAIRRSITDCREGDLLRAAIREALAAREAAKRPPAHLVDLEAERERLIEVRKNLYWDMQFGEPSAQEDAKANRARIDEMVRDVDRQIAEIRLTVDVPTPDIESQTESCLQMLDEVDLHLDTLPPNELHDVFQAFGVVLVVDFERRKVGRRENVPVAATVHLGGLPEGESPGELTLCSKSGRGDRSRTIPNAQQLLVEAALTRRPFRAIWSKALEMSGWRPLPHKPRARFNGTTFQVRRKGYKTVAEICTASGVPNTTFRRWLGKSLPELPLIDGIRAIPDEEFDGYVEVCRNVYLTAGRTRK